jgi:hypothetical protein
MNPHQVGYKKNFVEKERRRNLGDLDLGDRVLGVDDIGFSLAGNHSTNAGADQSAAFVDLASFPMATLEQRARSPEPPSIHRHGGSERHGALLALVFTSETLY